MIGRDNMIYILILIFIVILIFPGRWFIIFTVNKGRVKFRINELDLDNKYSEIEQTKNIKKLKEFYRNTILYEIIPHFFEIVSEKKTDLTDDDFEKEYDNFEREYNKLEKYKEENNCWIKRIFKETGRIAYKDFSYDFDYICKVNNKCINIIRLTNYFYMKGDGSVDSGRKYQFICRVYY